MLRILTNLLYRRRDPTRNWLPQASQVCADLRHCTLCGTKVNGLIQVGNGIEALGPSENAKRAARGFLEWQSQGINCLIDADRLLDYTIVLRPGVIGRYQPYTGKLEFAGHAIELRTATPAEVEKCLGEPFARSTSDGGLLLFYEYDSGEVQYAFEDDALVSIECAYEPELADKRSREFYAIDRELPAAMAQRRLG